MIKTDNVCVILAKVLASGNDFEEKVILMNLSKKRYFFK